MLAVFVWGSAAVTRIELPTMYVNTDVDVIYRKGDCRIQKVSMCGYYAGTHNMNIKIFHPHNPPNAIIDGITYFNVSTKMITDVSCHHALFRTNVLL